MSASSFALRMIWGGIACLVHGIFPFLFTTTGSDQIRLLHEKMVSKRHRQQPAGARPDARAQEA